jgi:hypothetical protein
VVVTGIIKLAQIAVAHDIDEGQRRATMLVRQAALHLGVMLLQDVHQDVPALIGDGEGVSVELGDVYHQLSCRHLNQKQSAQNSSPFLQ